MSQSVKASIPELNLRQKQTNNIIFITFWSQFSVYALNTVLILFLTRPLLEQGLGYSQAKTYTFIGVTQAAGYLVPILGGFMADTVIGVRRAILPGSMMLLLAYLLQRRMSRKGICLAYSTAAVSCCQQTLDRRV